MIARSTALLGPRSVACLVLMAGLGAGCALSSSTGEFAPDVSVRSPQGAPERFEVVAPAFLVQPADTTAGAGCTSPMVDPRDGTRIRFLRTGVTQGDYVVPEGRYGVGAGELLRLDCNTGRVVGIVRR